MSPAATEQALAVLSPLSASPCLQELACKPCRYLELSLANRTGTSRVSCMFGGRKKVERKKKIFFLSLLF